MSAYAHFSVREVLALTPLTQAINRIIDAVRKVVNVLLDAAKAFAELLIDGVAGFIKGAIGLFGTILKGAVDLLLSETCPDLAQKLNTKIDGAVADAQQAVDVVATGLKSGIAGLVEGLRTGLNAALDVFQGGLQLAVGLLEAAVTGDWAGLARKALEAVLQVVGVAPEEFYAFVGRAEETFQIILDDPLGFVGHCLDSVVGGVQKFGDNFLTHLQAGIIGWLTGQLGRAGITLPERFDLMGLLSLAQQVLGLTKERLRQRAVKLIGERNVEVIEFVWDYVETLLERGWSGLFERIREDLSGLVDQVLGGIKDFLLEKVVWAAITTLATLFNPRRRRP